MSAETGEPTEARPLPPALVVCGPTAAGKTGIAMAVADALPVRLISVDSVQVYRGLDIGSAKPDAATLSRYPHALIDIREPERPYSAADFAIDADREMRAASDAGRLPVLVGGTALYLRALRYGLDPMPAADPDIRARIEREAAEHGWRAQHARLAELDPASARGIRPTDPQRIQRALEVCLAGGRPASSYKQGPGPDRLGDSLMLIIAPADRSELHRRIDARWHEMLEAGLLDEAEELMERPGFRRDLPAARAVGYRQCIEFLSGESSRETLERRGAAATRQLAKRQLTAFRKWEGGMWYDPLNRRTIDRIISSVRDFSASAGRSSEKAPHHRRGR
ncbi:MAG: tRNA (adenosine(37)-N6)-dimethylallyltransferase MiaA [Candidatus Wenzhouxiangella sp. M2_3B_020]